MGSKLQKNKSSTNLAVSVPVDVTVEDRGVMNKNGSQPNLHFGGALEEFHIQDDEKVNQRMQALFLGHQYESAKKVELAQPSEPHVLDHQEMDSLKVTKKQKKSKKGKNSQSIIISPRPMEPEDGGNTDRKNNGRLKDNSLRVSMSVDPEGRENKNNNSDFWKHDESQKTMKKNKSKSKFTKMKVGQVVAIDESFT